MAKRYDAAVVGGGAAGLVAAISAARRGSSIVLCDRMPRLGKKILVTGGGRCNLSSEDLTTAAFSGPGRSLATAVFDRFGKDRIRGFFKEIGLETYSENGRVFPVTNQASSVLKVLEMEIQRLSVAVELGFEAVRIRPLEALFSVDSGDGRTIEARSVILTGGGKSYPALGSNGSAYSLAQQLGHHIVPPVPSAVPLLAKDRLCHLLQGQKVRAKATAIVGGKNTEAAEGEVLFTQYGLSGTAVLDVSESLSVAINREGQPSAAVVLDLVPFMARKILAAKLFQRLNSGWALEDLAVGILPDKLAAAIPNLLPARGDDRRAIADSLAATLKEKRFAVYGTRGWNEAEFTSGGVDTHEINSRTLESKWQKGLYLAGEILDVQGRRGGYNLAWAWASGFIAGLME